jgi:hypothetical protein
VRQRDLGTVRAMASQTYQQLVGDTCHAQHGLTLGQAPRAARRTNAETR